jgi:hypothetical protein
VVVVAVAVEVAVVAEVSENIFLSIDGIYFVQ